MINDKVRFDYKMEKHIRKTGFELPFAIKQVISWVVVTYNALVFALIISPTIDRATLISTAIIFTLTLIIVIISTVKATA